MEVFRGFEDVLKEVSLLTVEIEKLQKELDGFTVKPRTAKEKLASLDRAIEGIRNRRNNFEAEIQNLEAQLAICETSLDELQERRERLVAGDSKGGEQCWGN